MSVIEPKRIHQFDTVTETEWLRRPIWFELEVPNGDSSGYLNRKVSREKLLSSGGGSGQIIDCGARIGSGGERIVCGTRV